MVENNNMNVREIFFTFFKIGALTLGGGYVMVSVFEDVFIEKGNYLTHNDFAEMMMVSQATPGPIGITAAAYIGYRLKKIKGLVASTVGMILPSTAVIILIAVFYDQFSSLDVIENIFNGIRPVVVGIIAAAAYRIGKKSCKNKTSILIALVAAIVLIFTPLSSLSIIIIAIFIGVLITFFSELDKEGNNKNG
jgi:chromate transporter